MYYWNNDTNNNTWSESNLNKINLNQNYINNIGSTWSNKIATHSWKVGGMAYSNVKVTPKIAYNNEIGANSSSTTYRAKIGLIYVSDYGFASSNQSWTTTFNNYDNAKNDNWLYNSRLEWTITPVNNNSYVLFQIASTYIDGADGFVDFSGNLIRPCFYLNSDVEYVSESGTQSDPIQIQ